MLSFALSLFGIVACGALGGIAGWAVSTSLGWQGTGGALVAAAIAMVVAATAWIGAIATLRKLKAIR
jgi:hypothetical protein